MISLCSTKLQVSDITQARGLLKGVAHHTRLEYSGTFSQLVGREVYFKLENYQKTGSFKIRGAYNKIARLSDEEKRAGVIAASAGNHAQGVAYAANSAGISSTIVMPVGVPIAKLMATKGYGAQVVLGGHSYDEAYIKAIELKEETNQTFIHAFDDPQVIAGQGTIGLEILEDLSEVDTILVPIGGGGLISGISLAVKELKPSVKIIGVQAEGAAAVRNSFEHGQLEELKEVNTIADGIAIKHPGGLTFEIIKGYVDDIVTVTDEEISQAIMMLLERNKLLSEGAGAASVAALLHRKLPGGKTVAVITGGNIDVHVLSIIIERGLTKAGRYVRLNTMIPDRPGSLQRLLAVVAGTLANVISVNHDRIQPHIPIASAEVELVLETRDKEHVEAIISAIEGEGYKVTGC